MEKNLPQKKARKNEEAPCRSLVSVIVPVYNAESTLGKCLTSLKNQIYPDIEVILIDDGSTDQSAVICRKFCGEDVRFHYYRQDNQGVSAARSLGLEKAEGEYVCFCDSDDWVEPEIYTELLRVLKEGDCDIAVCGFVRHRGNKKEYFRPEREECLDAAQTGKLFWDYQERELWGTLWNKIYRRKMIRHSFDIHMNCGEDMAFNMQYMTGKTRFGFTDKVLYDVYSPVLTSIKYPNMNARQTFVYSDSLREFLDSIMDRQEYYGTYQRFLCDNFCRDAVTIALSKEYGEAKRLICQYYEYPDFCRVLQQRVYMASGWKYKMAGILLHGRRIGLLIRLMKTVGAVRKRRK